MRIVKIAHTGNKFGPRGDASVAFTILPEGFEDGYERMLWHKVTSNYVLEQDFNMESNWQSPKVVTLRYSPRHFGDPTGMDPTGMELLTKEQLLGVVNKFGAFIESFIPDVNLALEVDKRIEAAGLGKASWSAFNTEYKGDALWRVSFVLQSQMLDPDYSGAYRLGVNATRYLEPTREQFQDLSIEKLTEIRKELEAELADKELAELGRRLVSNKLKGAFLYRFDEQSYQAVSGKLIVQFRDSLREFPYANGRELKAIADQLDVVKLAEELGYTKALEESMVQNVESAKRQAQLRKEEREAKKKLEADWAALIASLN